jgi:hypothetical protein
MQVLTIDAYWKVRVVSNAANLGFEPVFAAAAYTADSKSRFVIV